MRNKAALTTLAMVLTMGFGVVNAEPKDSMLIKHGEVEITKDEYLRLISANLSDEQREQLFSNERSMRELLADYFVTRSLAQEAVDQGLDKADDVQFMREYNYQRLLSQVRVQRLIAEAEPRDYEALAREVYLAEPDQFKMPETVSVEHILVAAGDERNAEQAQERIKEVEAKLEGGESFGELAKQYSDDPSAASNKGKLGYFPRGQMVKPFENAAFAMTKSGETAIVQSNFGYHLIRFIGRRDAGTRPYDAVKAQLVEQQRQRHLSDLRNAKIESIRGDDAIEINEDAVSALFKQGQEQLNTDSPAPGKN